MAIKSKTQLDADISASTFSAPQQVILTDVVDSYEDVFAQLTTVQRNLLTPTLGMIVFNTDTNLYEYWNGTTWSTWSGFNTPMTVKCDLSAVDLGQLYTFKKHIITSYGAGTAILPISFGIRSTYGTTAYDFDSNGVGFYMADKTVAERFASFNNNYSVSFSTVAPASNAGAIDTLSENQDLMAAAEADPSTGDGMVSIYVTYSVIVW